MDKFKCQITNLSKDYSTGQAVITLTADAKILTSVEELLNVDLSCHLKHYRKERSQDANAYFWVLLDKLAEQLKIPKIDLYRGYIKNIGGNNTTVCVIDSAVGDLVKNWQHNGLGWQTETFGSKIKGCTNVILYYGSSTYDTEQMSRLIDLIVQDCQAVGIETKTPNELLELKARWGE